MYYCLQWSEVAQVSRQTKLAHIFYTSTHSLISFFVPYIKLCSCLQVKLDWKRCDEVIKNGCFPGGSLPPLSFVWHLCNIFQPSVPSYYAWRVVRLSSFPTHDFFQKVQSMCVYCFLISLFLPCTPVKDVVYLVVWITPWRSKLSWFVAMHLFLGGKQTE